MRDRKRALSLTVVAAILWGTSFPTIKFGLTLINPYVFVFLRMLVASFLIFLISYTTHNLTLDAARDRLIWTLGLLNGVAYLIQYLGMVYTSASKSSLFVNLSVVWVAFLSWWILKEQISQKKLLGIGLGLVGVFFITTNLNLQELAQGTVFGDGLIFLSGILWSVFIVYNKRVVKHSNPLQVMPWIFLATTLPLLPFILIPSNFMLLTLPLEAWTIIGYNAIFCWLVPYYFWLKGLQQISPATSTIILLIEVVVAIAISFVLLSEKFTLISGIGTLLIISAIILVSSR